MKYGYTKSVYLWGNPTLEDKVAILFGNSFNINKGLKDTASTGAFRERPHCQFWSAGQPKLPRGYDHILFSVSVSFHEGPSWGRTAWTPPTLPYPPPGDAPVRRLTNFRGSLTLTTVVNQICNTYLVYSQYL